MSYAKKEWMSFREEMANALVLEADKRGELLEALVRRGARDVVDNAYSTASAKKEALMLTEKEKAEAIQKLVSRALGTNKPPEAVKSIVKLWRQGHVDTNGAVTALKALGFKATVVKDGRIQIGDGINTWEFTKD